MSNVICFKTRQILYSVNEHLDQPLELRALLQRMELNDTPQHVETILSIQSAENGPYVGDCTHAIHPIRYQGQPFPFPNYSAPPKKVLGLGILDGSEPDPFMHMDKKYKATFRILKHAILIYTRSDLIAHDDYISELNKKAKIFIVFNDTNDDINALNEAGCPSYKRRVKAFEKLKSLGFDVKMYDEKKSMKIAK